MISFVLKKRVLALASIAMLVSCSSDNSSGADLDAASSSSVEEVSSSSEVASSSSVVESSSAFVESSSSAELESSSSLVYGKLLDERDGQEYRTVVIGDDTWMADNLNYDYLVDGVSYIYSNKNHPEYGRYYDYEFGIKDACPDGWHLPRYTDFRKLWLAVGANDSIGSKLINSEGWEDNEGSLNPYGFSALPTGYRTIDDAMAISKSAVFLTAESFPMGVNVMFIVTNQVVAWEQSSGFERAPVRCVKNKEDYQPLPDSASFKREEPCNSESGDNCKYGTLVDSRDGIAYKTVFVGSQEWMAENLQFANEDYVGAECYNGEADSCAKYGRAYTWASAMDSTAAFSEDGKDCGFKSTTVSDGRVRGVCPEGWHLPSDADFLTLMHATGTHVREDGSALASVEGWSAPGKNSYGFSVVPGGVDFQGVGFRACLWSTHEINEDYALAVSFGADSFDFTKELESSHCAVRCLKD